MPKISVIVPVYKVEKYLSQCVNSLINQTMRDIEIILVDDGSPDRCPEIIEEYVKIYSRIKAIHQNNKKLGGARNTGIACAKGKYIAFVDSDDWVSNEFCQRMYDRAIETNSDIVLIGETLYYDDKDKYSPGWRDFSNKTEVDFLNETNFLKYFTPAWGRLYNTEYIRRNNLKFVENCYYEDNSWGCFFILAKAKFSFAGNLYYYRQRLGSITAKKDAKVFDFIRDCEYFHSTINEKKNNEKEIKLCRLWYILNFYNYCNQLDNDLRERFHERVLTLVKNWKIKIEDMRLIADEKKKQVDIYKFINPYFSKEDAFAINKEIKKEICVYIFGVVLFLKMKYWDDKTKCYLFGFIPFFKKTVCGSKIKLFLFNFLPIIKIK